MNFNFDTYFYLAFITVILFGLIGYYLIKKKK